MLLGVSKVCITPPIGTFLGGYASRTKPCSSVSEDIFVRVHIHEFPKEKVSIMYIYADLAHWDNMVVQDLRNALTQKYGIASENMVFVASHSHSGPIVGHDELLLPPVKEDPEYTEFVKEKVVEAVSLAQAEKVEVSLTRYNSTSDLNVFRRASRNGVVYMEPNYSVPADKTLTVLAMRDAAGQIRGLMLHYPCHANVATGDDVHPDYPGIALRMLDDLYPQSISIFTQGCTGDLRPNSVCGNKFVPTKYENVVLFAKSFFDDCLNALQGDAVPIIEAPMISSTRFWLPQENLKDEKELIHLEKNGTSFEQAWAKGVLEKGNQPGAYMEVQRVSYGKELTFYTMNAEVVQRYAAYIRELDPYSTCITYANGMIGYISDAQEIVEGGYEPVGSAPYFLLSGTYTIEIDPIIRHALYELNRNHNG